RPRGQLAGGGQRTRPDLIAHGRHGERLGEIRATLREVRMQMPEPAERAGKLEEALRRARAQPIERDAEVVALALEEIEILLLPLAAPLVRVFGERFEIRRMPIANGAGKIALGELFQSEGADRLEHAEALALASYETLVYQTGHRIERSFAHGLCRF